MLPTIVIHPEERSFMTDIKTIEKDDLKNIEKLKPKELLIIPKKDL